jgi:hypothetical protein
LAYFEAALVTKEKKRFVRLTPAVQVWEEPEDSLDPDAAAEHQGDVHRNQPCSHTETGTKTTLRNQEVV